MNKEKPNEKQLLADAKLWFEQQHGQPPKECGIKFIKIWHKPTPFIKRTAIVFAQTEEAGKAFIWEQNAIFRSMTYFWILPIFMITAFFTVFSQETQEEMMQVMGIFISLIFGALLFSLYLARKCKKLEKIHQWNVDVYYP